MAQSWKEYSEIEKQIEENALIPEGLAAEFDMAIHGLFLHGVSTWRESNEVTVEYGGDEIAIFVFDTSTVNVILCTTQKEITIPVKDLPAWAVAFCNLWRLFEVAGSLVMDGDFIFEAEGCGVNIGGVAYGYEVENDIFTKQEGIYSLVYSFPELAKHIYKIQSQNG